MKLQPFFERSATYGDKFHAAATTTTNCKYIRFYFPTSEYFDRRRNEKSSSGVHFYFKDDERKDLLIGNNIVTNRLIDWDHYVKEQEIIFSRLEKKSFSLVSSKSEQQNLRIRVIPSLELVDDEIIAADVPYPSR